jgi:hypothetical protein
MRGSKEIALFKELASSVVLIGTLAAKSDMSSLGSGFIIDADGSIITNWHVVEHAEKMIAYLQPPLGEPPTEGFYLELIRKDPVRDLAVVRIISPPGDLNVAKFAESDAVEIGQDVHSIGHPKGEFWSFTSGRVSNLHKNYKWGESNQATVIQTQAPINPGNSGGPLLNDAGEIIGVNSFRHQEAQGLNYAVAASEVLKFLKSNAAAQAEGRITIVESSNGYTAYDRNGDGKADAWSMDQDQNDKWEFLEIDVDFDGTIDRVHIDFNENGTYEAIGYDTTDSGKMDSYMIDVDEDGTPDTYQYDPDEDGIIDREERA